MQGSGGKEAGSGGGEIPVSPSSLRPSLPQPWPVCVCSKRLLHGCCQLSELVWPEGSYPSASSSSLSCPRTAARGLRQEESQGLELGSGMVESLSPRAESGTPWTEPHGGGYFLPEVDFSEPPAGKTGLNPRLKHSKVDSRFTARKIRGPWGEM